jgi:hypothetical protein
MTIFFRGAGSGNIGPLIAVLASAAALTLAAGPVQAQAPKSQMYRCGNTFQSTPCGGADGKSQLSDSAKKAAERACAQRGSDARTVTAARDAGNTQAALIAAVNRKTIAFDKKLAERQLIEEVFPFKGTPDEAAAKFEADCLGGKKP